MPKIFNHVVHPGISQDWRGNLILGTCSEEAGYDNRNTLEALRNIAGQDLLKAPLLADLLIIRAYSGLRPMPFDGYPLVDRLPGYDDVFTVAAHSSIANCQIIARSLTEWVLQGRRGSDLEDHTLTRETLTHTPVPYRPD
jgi:sarcosine oxidase subunit beta